MNIIARLIRAALEACFDRGVIDWLPSSDYGMPESFFAECEIGLNSYWVGLPDDGYWSGDFYVRLNNVLCFIGFEDAFEGGPFSYWHSETVSEVEE